MIGLRLIPNYPDSRFCCVKWHDNCDKTVVNTYLDLIFFSIVDPMDSVLFSVIDVIDVCWSPPSPCPVGANSGNTKFPLS